MNIKEFSKIAGVSTATVSRALSGADGISESTRKRVVELAEQYNYVNKRAKKPDINNLNISVIVPEIKSEYFSNIVEHLNSLIQEDGGTMSLYISGFKSDAPQDIAKKLYRKGGIDGFIALNNSFEMFTCASPEHYWDDITVNLTEGIFRAVEHLVSLGHKKIGFIGEMFTRTEFNVFVKAMEAYRLPLKEEYVRISNKRFEEAGYECMKSLLDNHTDVTAVIAGYDYIAYGAMNIIHKYGLNTPDNMSIIGIDDISVSANLDIGLTSIKTYYHEMCSVALAILRKKIKDPNYRMVQSVSIQTELVVRNTTAPPPIKS